MAFEDFHLTPIAISQTNPVRVTVASHGLNSGMRLRATKFVTLPAPSATGMEQLNNLDFNIRTAGVNDFDLYDDQWVPVDGTGYTAYVSGGQFTITGPDNVYENQT